MTDSSKVAPAVSRQAKQRYIIETPNQLWHVDSHNNKFPCFLSDDHDYRQRIHVFVDLNIALRVLANLRHERGGAKLRVYHYLNDGSRQEVRL